jgi:hypothetical protein
MYILLYLLLGSLLASLLQSGVSNTAIGLSNQILDIVINEDPLKVADTRRRLQLFRFPTEAPSRSPTKSPSKSPSTPPSELPSGSPSQSPVSQQQPSPVADPQPSPVAVPQQSPIANPQSSPVTAPAPQSSPVVNPQSSPVTAPAPQSSPVVNPQSSPVTAPQASPVVNPQSSPVTAPAPQSSPVVNPQSSPVTAPQASPVVNPQSSPIAVPNPSPVTQPQPQASPTFPIFFQPTPSKQPTVPPTAAPSQTVSPTNTLSPTRSPTFSPSFRPTPGPTRQAYPVIIFNAHYKIDNIDSSDLNTETRLAIVQSIKQATYPNPSTVTIQHWLVTASETSRRNLRTSDSMVNLLALSNYTVDVSLEYNLVDFPEGTETATLTDEAIAGIESSITGGYLTYALRSNSYDENAGSLSEATASSVTVGNKIQTVNGGSSVPDELTHDEMAAIVVCSVFFACIVFAGIAFRLYPEVFVTHETVSQERDNNDRENQSASSHTEFPPVPEIIEFKDNPLSRKLSGSPMSPLSPGSPELIVSPSTAMMPVLISSFYALPTPEPTPDPSPEPLDTITEGEEGQETDSSEKEKISLLESIKEEGDRVEEVEEEEPPVTDNN